jgi:hypothetical protein
MKKNTTKDQEQNWKPRRLSLNRETIQALDDPALIEFARGGRLPSADFVVCCRTTSSH